MDLPTSHHGYQNARRGGVLVSLPSPTSLATSNFTAWNTTPLLPPLHGTSTATLRTHQSFRRTSGQANMLPAGRHGGNVPHLSNCFLLYLCFLWWLWLVVGAVIVSKKSIHLQPHHQTMATSRTATEKWQPHRG